MDFSQKAQRTVYSYHAKHVHRGRPSPDSTSWLQQQQQRDIQIYRGYSNGQKLLKITKKLI